MRFDTASAGSVSRFVRIDWQLFVGEPNVQLLRADDRCGAKPVSGVRVRWSPFVLIAISIIPLAIEGDVPLKMHSLAFKASSEIQFVRDLEAFYKSPLGQQVIGKRSL